MYRALPFTLVLATSCGCNENDEPKKKAKIAEAVPAPAPPAAPSVTPKSAGSGPGNARFRVDGQWIAATTDASAVAWRSGDVLERIQLKTSQDYRRREKLTFEVALQFPASFRPTPGTYAIAPDYRRRSDAVGATLITHTDYVTILAGDPTGELTITAVSPEGVAGKFAFEVWDKSDHEKHARVRSAKLSGNFTAVTLPAGRP